MPMTISFSCANALPVPPRDGQQCHAEAQSMCLCHLLAPFDAFFLLSPPRRWNFLTDIVRGVVTSSDGRIGALSPAAHRAKSRTVPSRRHVAPCGGYYP